MILKQNYRNDLLLLKNLFHRNLPNCTAIRIYCFEEKEVGLVGEETESQWYILKSEEPILGHTLGIAQMGGEDHQPC